MPRTRGWLARAAQIAPLGRPAKSARLVCCVPVLQEGSFCLPESAAIMRYLCETRQVADHWYPSET